MDKAGAIEMLMPVIQPADLWEESGRWNEFGPELMRFTDRHNRTFALGPTHEENVVPLVQQFVSSYKDVPVAFYQVQNIFTL